MSCICAVKVESRITYNVWVPERLDEMDLYPFRPIPYEVDGYFSRRSSATHNQQSWNATKRIHQSKRYTTNTILAVLRLCFALPWYDTTEEQNNCKVWLAACFCNAAQEGPSQLDAEHCGSRKGAVSTALPPGRKGCRDGWMSLGPAHVDKKCTASDSAQI